MYNEGYVNTNSPLVHPTANQKQQSPVIQDLITVFEKELSGFNELTLKIKGQVENIYRYNEPILKGIDEITEAMDAIGKLNSMVKTFGYYNQRLVDISNHLAKIA